MVPLTRARIIIRVLGARRLAVAVSRSSALTSVCRPPAIFSTVEIVGLEEPRWMPRNVSCETPERRPSSRSE
jgi:hypothetical protein